LAEQRLNNSFTVARFWDNEGTATIYIPQTARFIAAMKAPVLGGQAEGGFPSYGDPDYMKGRRQTHAAFPQDEESAEGW
jgi:hypothetical protein